ncbi:gp53-like domain-containing protein, partial [Acinetobacter sp. WCHAc060033]|uniref:gp53-like domain-containing protein n=1 Tax=Acinetobacter sp. WCHAc060033 TaxID=2518624 RepID=UPI003A599C2E
GWGVYRNSSATNFDPALPVNYGGTGATSVESAKVNLKINRFAQDPSVTSLYAPTTDSRIVITDKSWGIWSVNPEFDSALPVSSGGTGRKDGKAQALATPRKIELLGAVFGSASFDGSGNIVINTTYNSARNLNENGYIIHPDGRVEQWGYIAGGADEQIYTVNFPITFPNQCSNIQVSRMRKYSTVSVADADGGALVLEGTITRSSFVVDHQRFNSSSVGSLGGTMWRAIGY